MPIFDIVRHLIVFAIVVITLILYNIIPIAVQMDDFAHEMQKNMHELHVFLFEISELIRIPDQHAFP